MESRITLSRLVFVSTCALLFSCASSSAGVTTESGAGSTGTSSGTSTGSSGTTVGTGTGSTGAGGSDAGAGGSDAGAGGSDAALDAEAPTDADPHANWVLSWSDEFNTPAGTKPDPTYWSYDLGGGGWGLGQLQTYTNAAANAATDGTGNLAIVAIRDAQGNFTSARLKTEAKFEQAYGRFETRAKVVTGNGMWPAFWTLGNDFASAGWPQCGEIDIMEVRGTLPYGSSGALHGPGYSGNSDLKGRYELPDGGPKISDDFHTYAIEWEPGVVRFYVDNNLFATHTPADIPADAGPNAKWVYDHPFFILLNVAVGGSYAGPPTGTVFPQTMLVDYVRVYQRPNAGG
jgi:beta-glucanase (GH16 family)